MHGLRCRLFNSIDDVDPADWERVQSASAEPIFMDRRFIAAVEAGMRHGYTFWHAIVYDETICPSRAPASVPARSTSPTWPIRASFR